MNIFRTLLKSFIGPSSSPLVWNWASPTPWSQKQYIDEYQRYVYVAVSVIAENFAKIELEVYRKTGKEEVPIQNHPILPLLSNPNPEQSQFQFLEMHQTFMQLLGESFWYLVPTKLSRQPTMLVLIRPDMMEVVVDRNSELGFVSGYVMTKPDGTKVPFDKDEILHFKRPNPRNPYRGLGRIEAAMTYVQTEKYASEFTKNSIFNSGRPSGILNFKGTIDDVEFTQIKKRFRQEYAGTNNAGKTMLVNGAEGLDYQKLGMELGEVALQELKSMARDDIMIMFRVSKTLLGISDDVNRANAKENREVFIENVIKPEMDRFIDHLQTFLMPRWGGKDANTKLYYVDPAEEQIADRYEEWEKGWGKWLSTNDIRDERGLDPMPEGDVIYQPLNLVPMGEKLEMVTPPANTPGNKPKEEGKSVKKKEATRSPETIEAYRLAHYKIQAKYQQLYRKDLNRIFDAQEKEILQRNTKIFEEWKFDKAKYLALFLTVLTPIYQSLIQDEANLALDFADDTDTTFSIERLVNRYIEQRIRRFADEANEETLRQLTETIQEGVSAGESLSKMRKRVEGVFELARGDRSERIARTETTAASNYGALAAYEQSPVVTAKEWYAQPGACEFCRALNGKVVTLNTDYLKVGQTLEGVDGGRYIVNYENISFPPAHPNCECALLPVYR